MGGACSPVDLWPSNILLRVSIECHDWSDASLLWNAWWVVPDTTLIYREGSSMPRTCDFCFTCERLLGQVLRCLPQAGMVGPVNNHLYDVCLLRGFLCF